MNGLPAVPEMEHDLLGHCLIDNSAFLEAQELLTSADFSLGSHRMISVAIGSLITSGRPANMVTLTQYLLERGELDGIGGGAAYISSLTDGIVPSRAAVRDYAKSIAEKARLRRLIHVTHRASEDAQKPGAGAEEVLANIENELLELRAPSRQIRRASQRRFQRCSSAWIGSAIAKAICSACPPDLRPWMRSRADSSRASSSSSEQGPETGRAALMCQAAAANCRQETPVLLFSLEMGTQQLLRRLIAAESAVPFPRIADPRWATASDVRAIEEAAARIQKWPLRIVDDSSLSIERLTATARLAVRRDGVKLVAVDYVQIVSAQGRDERLRVAAVSRGLTRLAKDEDVPVLALSQLARADRSSPNRRPAMSDLRESSQLENDAHVVALLHREWDEDEGRLSSDGELIIAKHRSGETGAVPITFNRRSLTFESRPRDTANAVRREA